jgi:hypothetical protein
VVDITTPEHHLRWVETAKNKVMTGAGNTHDGCDVEIDVTICHLAATHTSGRALVRTTLVWGKISSAV